jgi:Flp pilus assembly pilin Flp
MYIKNKRGQSTVEYILLVTAVIAVMIVFSVSGGGLQGQLNSTLNTFATAINSESGAYDGSHSSPSGGTGSPGYTVNVNPS